MGMYKYMQCIVVEFTQKLQEVPINYPKYVLYIETKKRTKKKQKQKIVDG